MRTVCALPLMVLLTLLGCSRESSDKPGNDVAGGGQRFPVPMIEYAPRGYVCYRAASTIEIDGRLDEASWLAAPWTEEFVDIEGSLKPTPRFQTRAKMIWDSSYLYVGADMVEPHVWATLTARDAVIYHDNDFEVFIDPDGDSHEYYELEINAFGTEWDLLLIRPYRDGAPAVNAWDINGLKSAIDIRGTINHPSDSDSGWRVEIAIPWKVLAECAHRPSPPHEGDQWWLNFSRVQWRTEIIDGGYRKSVDTLTGKPLAEDNWVWSPQGLIAMHYPEMWGLVQFSEEVVGEKHVAFDQHPEHAARWLLWQAYYYQKQFHMSTGRYAGEMPRSYYDSANAVGYTMPPRMEVSDNGFDAWLDDDEGECRLRINETGRLVKETFTDR